VSKNVACLLLAIITTIDASRILYFPLPKIHSLHHELPIVQEPIKQSNEEKLINDEYIPSSAMERNMYEEQDESEKRDTFDLDALTDEKASVKRRIIVNEHLPANLRELNYLDRNTRKPIKTHINDEEIDAAIDRFSELNGNNIINEPWIVDTATGRAEWLQSQALLNDIERKKRRNDALFIGIVGVCSLVGVLGLVAAAIFWYKIQKRAEAALDAEYPSYGVTGPSSSGGKISPSSTMSDRKLAQSAQMFHYQQQRQQMMAQEKSHLDAKPVHSDDSDDEAPTGGDYTVYECPGLAPTGEMEVRNPLFAEPDSSLTSAGSTSHPTTNNHYPQLTTSISSSSPPKEKLLS